MREIAPDLVWEHVKSIRESSPFVHNITNYVVMELTANALLALGASPIMAHSPEEVGEIASISNALVLNIGTLSNNWILGMKKAFRESCHRKIPIVLDPVGAGATSYRTQISLDFLNSGELTIIKGNASEIGSLAANCFTTKGVESQHNPEQVLDLAQQLAEDYKTIVCISGPNDYITDGNVTYKISNGHPIMSKVTGIGCVASALLGAFLANSEDYLTASVCSMIMIGIAGEIAAANSNGPGSFKAHFHDALFHLDLSHITEKMQVTLDESSRVSS